MLIDVGRHGLHIQIPDAQFCLSRGDPSLKAIQTEHCEATDNLDSYQSAHIRFTHLDLNLTMNPIYHLFFPTKRYIS